MASNIIQPDYSSAEEPREFTPARGDVAAQGSPVTAAVKELFRRWPAVPTRELERLRRALLQCEGTDFGGSGHQLSEPARAALVVITAELQRRGRTNTEHAPGSGGGS